MFSVFQEIFAFSKIKKLFFYKFYSFNFYNQVYNSFWFICYIYCEVY